PGPTSVRAQATIFDVNRQAWSTASLVTVHSSSHYVGLKANRYFYQLNQPIVVSTIVADLDGKLMGGRTITMRAVRFAGRIVKGKYQELEVDPQDCTVKSALDEKAPAKCTFQTKKGGVYQITADVTDDKSGQNRTVLTRWVAGGKMPLKPKVEIE